MEIRNEKGIDIVGYLKKGEKHMTNVIIYEIIQKKDYSLQKLVDFFENNYQDETQGIIVNEYAEEFLKATYWQKKIQRGYRFNLEKKVYDIIEEEIVNTVEFGIEIVDRKFLVFGNQQMAQRIITLLGISSNNAYSITEFIVDIEKLVQKICIEQNIVLIKMRLADITIEKGVMVNCLVNLVKQDEPQRLALKYVNNITVIAFKLKEIPVNITVYKSGRFSIGKIDADEKDELIQQIVRIVK